MAARDSENIDGRFVANDSTPDITVSCKKLDAGDEKYVCSTNQPCMDKSDCPTLAPVKCGGLWRCDDKICVYACY